MTKDRLRIEDSGTEDDGEKVPGKKKAEVGQRMDRIGSSQRSEPCSNCCKGGQIRSEGKVEPCVHIYREVQGSGRYTKG